MYHYYSSYTQTLDKKGRLVLPGRLRRVAEAETGRFSEPISFTMRYLDGGLCLFTERAWAPIARQYEKYSTLNPEARRKKRNFFSAVGDVSCDRQGRIAIPGYWRRKAKLKDRVVVIGAGDHIEIWAEEEFPCVDEELDTIGEEFPMRLVGDPGPEEPQGEQGGSPDPGTGASVEGVS